MSERTDNGDYVRLESGEDVSTPTPPDPPGKRTRGESGEAGYTQERLPLELIVADVETLRRWAEVFSALPDMPSFFDSLEKG